MCEAEERYLKEQLATLHQAYLMATEPYIKRLAEIYSMRPPQPIIINIAHIDPSMLDKLTQL